MKYFPEFWLSCKIFEEKLQSCEQVKLLKQQFLLPSCNLKLY